MPQIASHQPKDLDIIRLALILIALSGCSAVFDSEGIAIAELERYAVAHQQFYRPDIRIQYVFTDRPGLECRRAGLQVDALACAVLSDPCIVILPWEPTRAMIREEQLHCVYGDWHGRH